MAAYKKSTNYESLKCVQCKGTNGLDWLMNQGDPWANSDDEEFDPHADTPSELWEELCGFRCTCCYCIRCQLCIELNTNTGNIICKTCDGSTELLEWYKMEICTKCHERDTPSEMHKKNGSWRHSSKNSDCKKKTAERKEKKRAKKQGLNVKRAKK